jgi:hypothetical protein
LTKILQTKINTNEFGDWWDTLLEHEQNEVAAIVELL